MRKLIVTEFVSVDGVMRPLAERRDTRTPASFYGAWPLRDDPMADKISAMTKEVVSATLGKSDWQNTTVIAADVERAVGERKASGGGPILIAGSRTLAQSLLAAGLVDEINLQVFPLLLGSGDRPYPETTEKRALHLVSSRALTDGVLHQTYAVSPSS